LAQCSFFEIAITCFAGGQAGIPGLGLWKLGDRTAATRTDAGLNDNSQLFFSGPPCSVTEKQLLLI